MKPTDPAFPTDAFVGPKQFPTKGIDLRTYLAAKALQGFASNTDLPRVMQQAGLETPQSVAAYSVKWAEALIAELSKDQPPSPA